MKKRKGGEGKEKEKEKEKGAAYCLLVTQHIAFLSFFFSCFGLITTAA